MHVRDLTNEYPGLIRQRNWYGKNGMEHLLTTKTPKQPIPTFEQTIALLMKVSLAIRSTHALTISSSTPVFL